MKLTTTTRRIASTFAAAAIASLATVAPAAAIPDPGPSIPTDSVGTTAVVREIVHEDDDAVEYLQVGLGAAAGVALAGGAALALSAWSKRSRRALNPT